MLLMRPAAIVFPARSPGLLMAIVGAHEKGVVVGRSRPDAGIGDQRASARAHCRGRSAVPSVRCRRIRRCRHKRLRPSRRPATIDGPGDVELLLGEEALVARDEHGRCSWSAAESRDGRLPQEDRLCQDFARRCAGKRNNKCENAESQAELFHVMLLRLPLPRRTGKARIGRTLPYRRCVRLRANIARERAEVSTYPRARRDDYK